MFHSKIIAKHQSARIMQVQTAHGSFTTPAFMPVGTRAAVNSLLPYELVALGSEIILGGNTYHMLVAPQMEIIQNAGGMHNFMAWNQSMLTDSGGFQVFSLAKNEKLCQINANGARFLHPQQKNIIELTPESSIATQKIIGADIIMAFDECTPDTNDAAIIKQALIRTHNWLRRCKQFHDNQPSTPYGYRQALFGIIQGGSLQKYREISAKFVVDLDFDGIAIGGETIGFDMQKTVEIVNWLRPILPENKIRYTMGVGASPQDLLDVIKVGIDIFDCVAPTRNARHGSLYSGEFIMQDNWPKFVSEFNNARLNIKKSQFANDEQPIMANCDCFTCNQYTRSYLHYLFKTNSPSYINLACAHNVRVMHLACEAVKHIINI